MDMTTPPPKKLQGKEKNLPKKPSNGEQLLSHEEFTSQVTEIYSSLLRRAYNYLRCNSLAEDAVQEGVLAAYRAIHTFRGDGSFSAWVHMIVTRKALDILRKRKRLILSGMEEKDIVSYSKLGLLEEPYLRRIPNPEDMLVDAQHIAMVNDAVQNLKDLYRIPLIMKDFDNLTIKEISEILGITKSNTKVRIHRARIMVKNALSDYFYNVDKEPKNES
jgi:RNA polymerase sigma-70 factor (ECF subfamily)